MVSWNVNGLRAVLKKGFTDYLAAAGADVICLQEVRALPEQVEFAPEGYAAHWHPAEKKGYSGVMTLSRRPPLSVTRGLGGLLDDREGRVLTAEFDDFYLVNCYTPNSGRDLARLEYRQKTWDPAFLAWLKRLEDEKPVVFCGDLNVAHQPIDLANPKGNERNAGYTIEEREGFSRLVDSGFVDTFRHFEPGGGHYSWWSYFGKAREKNVGWRIDYFCVSAGLASRLEAAGIEPAVGGSDHCPVTLNLRNGAG